MNGKLKNVFNDVASSIGSNTAPGLLIKSLIIAVCGLASLVVNGELTHRYSFDDTAAVIDSVGSAHGTLQGGAYISSGSVYLDGTAGTFVDLPGGLINGYNAVSFEAWASFGQNGNWCRLYDFGDTSPSGNGRFYVMMTPHSGNGDARVSIADADPGYNHEFVGISPGVLDYKENVHIVTVYNPESRFIALYINGKIAGFNTNVPVSLSAIQNVKSYLGKSLYNPDAYLVGSIDEFRIYNHALSPAEIALDYANGPSIVSSDTGNLVGLEILGNNSMKLGAIQLLDVKANYSRISGVSLYGDPKVQFISDNPEIVKVGTDGRVVAMAVGNATVTATYMGVSASIQIKVQEKPPVLVHRYSFTEDASDSIGGAHGELIGGAYIDSGSLVLDGTSGYVNLPNGLISGISSITVETWVTDFGSRSWARVFDFGDSAQGEDLTGLGTKYLFLSLPDGDGFLRGEYKSPDGVVQMVRWSGRPVINQKTHIVFTSKAIDHTARIYVNGRVVAENTNITITPMDLGETLNNWIGKSQFNDPYFYGSIDEFRIYDGALDPLIIAAHTAAGPDKLVDNVGSLLALKINASDSMDEGGVQIMSVLADFDQIANVPLSSSIGLEYSVDNPKIASVTADGKLLALKPGVVTVTAKFGSLTQTKTIKINEKPAALIHRYSFDNDFSDSVGGANGIPVGGATIADGVLQLDGNGSYVDLPNGLFTNIYSITIEAWVVDRGSMGWARIFDFGSSAGGEDMSNGGTRYMFLSLPSGPGNLRGGLTITGGGAGEQVLEWVGGRPEVNTTNHIVFVTKASEHTGKLYVNGKLVGINTNLTITPNDLEPTVNNWIGRSQFADPYFFGDIDEFRIYDGALDAFNIAVNYALGPDKLMASPGQLKAVRLQFESKMTKGTVQTLNFVGDFENVSNVVLNALSETTFISSDPQILGVGESGTVEAWGNGVAEIVASYHGFSATGRVEVVFPEGVPGKPLLLHRYSFNETQGTTITDSAGGANGTLVGNGILSDGKLVLTNGAYVDLPNRIISGLTNITIEAWVSWNGPQDSSWQRIFDFGNNSNGEGNQGTGTSFFFITPRSGSGTLLVSVNAGGGNYRDINVPIMPLNQLIHIVFSYDRLAGISRLYINGQRVATGVADIDLALIDDVNNWLGRSNWPDPAFNGVFDEFRIWSGAMTDPEVAQYYSAGPNSLEPVSVKPGLNISLKNLEIELSWSAAAAGFTLEKSDQLGTNIIWSVLNVTPSQMNDKLVVRIPISGNVGFFRLRK